MFSSVHASLRKKLRTPANRIPKTVHKSLIADLRGKFRDISLTRCFKVASTKDEQEKAFSAMYRCCTICRSLVALSLSRLDSSCSLGFSSVASCAPRPNSSFCNFCKLIMCGRAIHIAPNTWRQIMRKCLIVYRRMGEGSCEW